MKLINTITGATIAEIMTNNSMSIDDCIKLMQWEIDEDGEIIIDNKPSGNYYDDIEMIY